MRKLTLDISALRVETFSTAQAEAAGQGTIRAHSGWEATYPQECGDVGESTGDARICVCDTTHTARFPECGGDTELCA